MNKKPLKKMPRGEGTMSYVTRKNKEYICYKKIVGEGTNKIRHSVYGTTQQECIKLMKEFEKEYNDKNSLLNPAKDGNDKNILSASMSVWLYETKSRTIKASSFDLLECIFVNHIKDSDIGKLQFSRVTSDDINEFLKIKRAAGYSLSTIHKMYTIFNQYFEFVYAKNKEQNPMLFVNRPNKKDDIPNIVVDAGGDDDIFIETKDGIDINSSKIILDDEEMQRFVDIASVEFKNRHQGWKHGNGIIFIMYSFLRVGEAVALKWKDVNFENKTVDIYKTMSCIQDRSDSINKEKWVITTTKTASGRRTNILSDKAIDALKKHFDSMAQGRTMEEMKNHYVFETYCGSFVKPPNLYKSLKQIMEAAGIDKSKIGLHKLRHTGISYYIRHGVPIDIISKMAGHKSTITTMRVYYGLVDQQFQDAVNIMNSIKS